MIDKEMDKFLEDVANNTPNAGQFDNVFEEDKVSDFEEDLCGGKSFKSMRETTKIKK